MHVDTLRSQLTDRTKQLVNSSQPKTVINDLHPGIIDHAVETLKGGKSLLVFDIIDLEDWNSYVT